MFLSFEGFSPDHREHLEKRSQGLRLLESTVLLFIVDREVQEVASRHPLLQDHEVLSSLHFPQQTGYMGREVFLPKADALEFAGHFVAISLLVKNIPLGAAYPGDAAPRTGVQDGFEFEGIVLDVEVEGFNPFRRDW